MRYLTLRPTIGLKYLDHHYAAVTIPPRKVFELVGPAEDEDFVVIEMDGERFRILATDLEDRCAKRPLRKRRRDELTASV